VDFFFVERKSGIYWDLGGWLKAPKAWLSKEAREFISLGFLPLGQ